MAKRKRSPKNLIRTFLVNFFKLIVLLIVTPPIAFVITILVLDYNPFTQKLNAYARVSQMSEWKLPANSELVSFETTESELDGECSLEGVLIISSHLSEDAFRDFYLESHFETYKHSFRDFAIQAKSEHVKDRGIYRVIGRRFWQC